MSILTNKHVLVVGDKTKQISKIEAALITYGATITTATCTEVSEDMLQESQIDLVLLNHLHDGEHCAHVLESHSNTQFAKVVPVFVLVEHDDDKIADALMLGAADYITSDEDVHDVIEKVKAVFGQSLHQSSDITIDLTLNKSDGSGKGVRVFALEDDPLLSNLLAIKFEKSQIPFEIATDSENIVARIKAFRPQIVILDLMVPGKDGFEVLQEIRADADITDLPVLIFSNKDNPEDRKLASELGVKGFYVKALTDLSELMNMIEKFARN